MTEDEVFDALQGFLRKIDAERVDIVPGHIALSHLIAGYVNAPRPTGPYAAIYPLASRDTLEADDLCFSTMTLHDVPQVLEERTRALEYKFRIDVYASRPSNSALAFMAALRSSRAQVDLWPLVVRRIDAVAMSGELKGQQWEGKASFNVELAALRTEKTIIDTIETGDITFEGEGGATVLAATSYQRT